MADWKMNGTAGNVTDSSPPATATARGGVKLANDLGGTADLPTVVAAHLSAPLPEAQGGTGAATLGAGTVAATGGVAARSVSNLAADARRGHARSAGESVVRDIDVSRAVASLGVAPDNSPTPYYGTELVHPDVVYLPQGWNGHRYWMAVTPYPSSNSAYENPSIYCSHDGRTWVTPDGASNPVVPQPADGFNSDPDLVDGFDGRLYLFWRQHTVSAPATSMWWVKHSLDGVTWSEPVKIFETVVATETAASLSVVYDGTTWVGYYVDTNTYAIKRISCATATGAWSGAVAVTVADPSGLKPWHVNAIRHGRKTILLIQEAAAGAFGSGGSLWFAWSTDDGVTFALASSAVLPSIVAGWAATMYRSALAVISDGVDTRIAIWASTYGATYGWRLAYTEAVLRPDTVGRLFDATSINGLAAARAMSRVHPGVMGDNFARPDATALGVSPSGHAWVVASGAMSIASNLLASPDTNNNRVTVDVGLSDCTVATRFAALGSNTYLMFRYQDVNNFWRLGFVAAANSYRLEKIVGGVTTALLTSIAIPAAGDWLEVRLSGSTISVYLNGLLRWTGTDADLAAATKHGLQLANTTARVSAFYVEGSELAPTTSTTFLGRLVVSASAPPTATAALRGVVWQTIAGAGTADTVQVCAKDAANAYAWRTIY